MTRITSEQVSSYDTETFTQIAQLMPMLDESFRPDGFTEDHFNQWFHNNPDRAVFVARLGDRILGSMTANVVVEQAPEALHVEIGGVVTDREARGKGAALTQLRRVMHFARLQKVPKATLNTETTRPEAIALYERFGFSQVPGTVGHYEYAIPEVAIPDEVLDAYCLTSGTVISPIETGIVNKTFLTEDGTATTILQQLNPGFNKDLIIDNAVVAAHLTQHGWEAPEVLPDRHGELSHQDDQGGVWRQLRFIESSQLTPAMQSNEKLLFHVGHMLGRWHQTMRSLAYEPQNALPHFHDTQYFANKLAEYRPASRFDAQVAAQADSLLSSHSRLPALPDGNEQLIHGDPQLSNILFRNYLPLTYIDLDTVMRGSIFLDIGDLMRSVAEAELIAGKTVDIGKLISIADGYRSQAMPDTDIHEFRKLALLATKTVATELAMRFIIDIADDCYFKWDSTRFESRRDNHLYRADIQRSIVAAIEELEKPVIIEGQLGWADFFRQIERTRQEFDWIKPFSLPKEKEEQE